MTFHLLLPIRAAEAQAQLCPFSMLLQYLLPAQCTNSIAYNFDSCPKFQQQLYRITNYKICKASIVSHTPTRPVVLCTSSPSPLGHCRFHGTRSMLPIYLFARLLSAQHPNNLILFVGNNKREKPSLSLLLYIDILAMHLAPIFLLLRSSDETLKSDRHTMFYEREEKKRTTTRCETMVWCATVMCALEGGRQET